MLGKFRFTTHSSDKITFFPFFHAKVGSVLVYISYKRLCNFAQSFHHTQCSFCLEVAICCFFKACFPMFQSIILFIGISSSCTKKNLLVRLSKPSSYQNLFKSSGDTNIYNTGPIINSSDTLYK